MRSSGWAALSALLSGEVDLQKKVLAIFKRAKPDPAEIGAALAEFAERIVPSLAGDFAEWLPGDSPIEPVEPEPALPALDQSLRIEPVKDLAELVSLTGELLRATDDVIEVERIDSRD